MGERQYWQAGLLSVSVLQAAAAVEAWPHFPAMQADSPELDKFLKWFGAQQRNYPNYLCLGETSYYGQDNIRGKKKKNMPKTNIMTVLDDKVSCL